MSNNDERFSVINVSKEAIIEWFSTSTTHALPNIVKARNVLVVKIIWACCFIASTVYCSITLKKLLDDYYSYSSTTSTKFISESPALFPAVTICNIKTVDKKNNLDYVNSFMGSYNNESYYNFTPYFFIHSMIYDLRFNVNTKLTDNETKKKIGYQIEDILISCYYNFRLLFWGRRGLNTLPHPSTTTKESSCRTWPCCPSPGFSFVISCPACCRFLVY